MTNAFLCNLKGNCKNLKPKAKANSQSMQYILYFCRLFCDVETSFGHIIAGIDVLLNGFLPKEG